LSNKEALNSFATAAGLVPSQIRDVHTPWQYPDLATALKGIMSAGVSVKAIEHSSEEAVSAAYSKALAQFTLPDGSVLLNASFRYLVAHA
jgi:hypothetical protein